METKRPADPADLIRDRLRELMSDGPAPVNPGAEILTEAMR